MNPIGLLVVAVMVLAVILIPVGLPGLWAVVALIGLGVWLGEVAGWILVTSAGLAIVAEAGEWLIVSRMSARYGGSSKAFWGALGGGVVGVLVGAPLPIVGSMVGGFLGSFLGAALVTYRELADVEVAGRVGWGVLVARTLSVGMKVAVAVALVVLGGAAWIVR